MNAGDGDEQSARERDERFDPLSDESSMEDTGLERSSRQTKSKEAQRFGDPVNHSIEKILQEKFSGALLNVIADY